LFRKFLSILKVSGIGTACAGVFASITGFIQEEGALAIIAVFLLALAGCSTDVIITGEGSGTVRGTDDLICRITNGVARNATGGDCIFRTNGTVALEAIPDASFAVDTWTVNPASAITSGCGVGSTTCIIYVDTNDVSIKVVFKLV
jgi:hypothetical protein